MAGAGNDVVDAGPETGRDPDAYDGGSGIDTLSYHQRTTGIFAAAIGSTGGASGNDDIAGFERINGGAGNDSILGFSSNGGPGNDVLTGSNGDDTIVGGTGADTLRGFGGDDLINANDGVADTRIDCSAGIDTVFLDLKDPVPNDAENCELIDRRKVDEEPGTEILTSSARLRDGHIGVRLHCPRKARCAGTLNHVRYRIRPRASTTVRVPTRHKGVVVVTSREAGARAPRPWSPACGSAERRRSPRRARLRRRADRPAPRARGGCRTRPRRGRACRRSRSRASRPRRASRPCAAAIAALERPSAISAEHLALAPGELLERPAALERDELRDDLGVERGAAAATRRRRRRTRACRRRAP